LYACEPGVEGRFRVWISWGCGSGVETDHALYLIDRDGDLTTTSDQVELANVDERYFADGTGELRGTNRLWSGFYDAGVWNLAGPNRIILRAGAAPALVTAGAVFLEEEGSVDVLAAGSSGGSEDSSENHSTAAIRTNRTARFLRAAVNPR